MNDFATHQGGRSLLEALQGVEERVRELEAALEDAGAAAQRDAARRSEVELELAQRAAHESDVRAQLDEVRHEADRLRSRLDSAEARARQAVEDERVEREQLRVQAEGLRAEVARLRTALDEERAAHKGQVDAMAKFRAQVAEGRQQWSRMEALLDELAKAETATETAARPAPAERTAPAERAAPAEPPQELASRPTRTSNPVEPAGDATRVASPAPAPPPAPPPAAAPPAPARNERGDIDDLARSDLGRAERVSAQGALERLPSRLEPDEQPKRLVIAEYAGAVALMAVTDRRILLLKLEEQEYQAIPYGRVTSVEVSEERFGRGSLRVASDAGDVLVSRRRRDAVEELSRLLREQARVA